jgi:hypothetical protein
MNDSKIKDLLATKPTSPELLDLYDEISYTARRNLDGRLIENAARILINKFENEIRNPSFEDRDFYNNASIYLMGL